MYSFNGLVTTVQVVYELDGPCGRQAVSVRFVGSVGQ